MRSLASIAAVAALLCCANAKSAGGGSIIGAAVNGTTNELQLIVADLESFIVATLGPSYAGLLSYGQAAAVLGGVFWTSLMNVTGGVTLCGFDVATGAMVANLPTTDFPGISSGDVWLEDLFPLPDGRLRAVGYAPRLQQQMVWDVNASTAAVSLLGAVNTSGTACGDFGDAAFDAASGRLFLTCAQSYDDPAGATVLVVNATGGAGFGTVLASFGIPNHLDFLQWDPVRAELVGLGLQLGGPDGYARNLTWVTAAGSLSSAGELGAFYVDLEDGPKALDAAGRRAFYMLATSPLGEMDVVAVDLESSPPVILESPGLCGFVGYCPAAFAFRSSSSG